MHMDMIKRVELVSLARYWTQLADRTDLGNSVRNSYRDCGEVLSQLLGSPVAAVGPIRRMSVTVYGFVNHAMEDEARRTGQEVFPGLDVAVVSFHLLEPRTSEQRARAAALTAPVFDGDEQVSPGRGGTVYMAEVTLAATEPDPAQTPEFAGRQREPLAATENANGGSSV
jgi:hypothetical protein